MASQEKLKQLLWVAKASKTFVGMKEDDVWQACLAYQDKSDQTIDAAISNIQKDDQRIQAEHDKEKSAMEISHDKMKQIREAETLDEQKESNKAEVLLKQLMPVKIHKSWLRRLWEFLTKKI